MARSTYIYILIHKKTDNIIGAWTVKREMNEWIEYEKINPEEYEVLRAKDNARNMRPVIIPWENIKEQYRAKKES